MTAAINHDVVSVFTYGLADHRAECSCGWQSKQRIRKGRAIFDALIHACDTGCRENWPLVYPSQDYRPTDAPSWRDRILAVSWAAAAWTIPLAGLLAIPAPAAHADPITDLTAVEFSFVNTFGQGLCTVIDKYPSKDGVVGIRQAVMGQGFTDGEAQTILAATAETYCPAHFQLVQSSAGMAAISPVVKS